MTDEPNEEPEKSEYDYHSQWDVQDGLRTVRFARDECEYFDCPDWIKVYELNKDATEIGLSDQKGDYILFSRREVSLLMPLLQHWLERRRLPGEKEGADK